MDIKSKYKALKPKLKFLLVHAINHYKDQIEIEKKVEYTKSFKSLRNIKGAYNKPIIHLDNINFKNESTILEDLIYTGQTEFLKTSPDNSTVMDGESSM